MKKLLAVVITLGLWHSAVLANLLPVEMPGKVSPTVDEISFQSFRAESSTVDTNPFAMKSEGAFMVAPLCWIIIDPTLGFAEQICW